jgi:hypothetical protein
MEGNSLRHVHKHHPPQSSNAPHQDVDVPQTCRICVCLQTP